MKEETLDKAVFIRDNITLLRRKINEWENKKVDDLVECVILSRIDLNEVFSVFRDGVILKMEKHKKMLEEELAKL